MPGRGRERGVGGHARELGVLGRQREPGALQERLLDEAVGVEALAADRNEERARRHLARVGRDGGDPGIAVDRTGLKEAWRKRTGDVIQAATLRITDEQWSIRGGREGIHTEHLGYLLAELQFMQRAYPGLQW